MEGINYDPTIAVINKAIFTLRMQTHTMEDVERIWKLFPRAPKGVDG